VANSQAREKIDKIIGESIEMMLGELSSSGASGGGLTTLLERGEFPFTPMTFTLWRRVAVKHLRKKVLWNPKYRDCVRRADVME
jgi:hypothetical protein